MFKEGTWIVRSDFLVDLTVEPGRAPLLALSDAEARRALDVAARLPLWPSVPDPPVWTKSDLQSHPFVRGGGREGEEKDTPTDTLQKTGPAPGLPCTVLLHLDPP